MRLACLFPAAVYLHVDDCGILKTFIVLVTYVTCSDSLSGEDGLAGAIEVVPACSYLNMVRRH